MIGLKRLFMASALLLILSLSASCVYAQEVIRPDVKWKWSKSPPFTQGDSIQITVNVTNPSNVTILLQFVGVRFEWMKENVFFIDGGSGKNRTLAPGEGVTYVIGCHVDENVPAGRYKATVLVAYNYNKTEGEPANPPAIAFIEPIEVVAKGVGGAPWFPQIDMTTIAVIIIIVLIIWLERGRIASLLRRERKVEAAPKKEEL